MVAASVRGRIHGSSSERMPSLVTASVQQLVSRSMTPPSKSVRQHRSALRSGRTCPADRCDMSRGQVVTGHRRVTRDLRVLSRQCPRAAPDVSLGTGSGCTLGHEHRHGADSSDRNDPPCRWRPPDPNEILSRSPHLSRPRPNRSAGQVRTGRDRSTGHGKTLEALSIGVGPQSATRATPGGPPSDAYRRHRPLKAPR